MLIAGKPITSAPTLNPDPFFVVSDITAGIYNALHGTLRTITSFTHPYVHPHATKSHQAELRGRFVSILLGYGHPYKEVRNNCSCFFFFVFSVPSFFFFFFFFFSPPPLFFFFFFFFFGPGSVSLIEKDFLPILFKFDKHD